MDVRRGQEPGGQSSRSAGDRAQRSAELHGCIKQVRKEIPSLAKTSAATLKTACEQLFTSLAGQVMDFLITAYWYQADAHKLGVNVTPAASAGRVQHRQEAEVQDRRRVQQFPQRDRPDAADITYRVRINTIVQKLVAKHTKKVTQADIAAYYNIHPTQFGTPESRNMRIVLTKTAAQANTGQDGAAVGSELGGGRRRSTRPTRRPRTAAACSWA